MTLLLRRWFNAVQGRQRLVHLQHLSEIELGRCHFDGRCSNTFADIHQILAHHLQLLEPDFLKRVGLSETLHFQDCCTEDSVELHVVAVAQECAGIHAAAETEDFFQRGTALLPSRVFIAESLEFIGHALPGVRNHTCPQLVADILETAFEDNATLELCRCQATWCIALSLIGGIQPESDFVVEFHQILDLGHGITGCHCDSWSGCHRGALLGRWDCAEWLRYGCLCKIGGNGIGIVDHVGFRIVETTCNRWHGRVPGGPGVLEVGDFRIGCKSFVSRALVI